ncbi:hypothetical protein RTP6_7756 [Batrachochytrium dendrobatidis]
MQVNSHVSNVLCNQNTIFRCTTIIQILCCIPFWIHACFGKVWCIFTSIGWLGNSVLHTTARLFWRISR